MPIPEDIEPEPHVDTRMLEFVQRRREEQATARRQRVQAIAITALGIIGIILTVSNAVLVSRLVARPVTPPAVIPAPMRSAPSAARVEPPPAPASQPPQPTPAPTPPAASVRSEARAAAPAASVRSEPRSEAPTPSVGNEPRTTEQTAPPTSDPSRRESSPPALPERSVPVARPSAVRESRQPGAPRETVSTAIETDPALRTAQWMIRTYGPLDAETKALAAAEFYTGDDSAFWDRVVAHVRAFR